MANVTVFKDNKVFIQTGIFKPNDLLTQMSVESMCTKYGFIIPLECTWPVIFDFLEGSLDRVRQAECATICNILTPSGKLYEYRVPAEAEKHRTYMMRRRVHYGPGVTYVRAATSKLEEQMTMAVHITDNLYQAGELLRKCSLGGLPKFEVLDVEEILGMLFAKGFTEDHNLQPPIKKISAEERAERAMRQADENMGYAEPMNQSSDEG
jgi:hypothetical protein